MKLKTQITAVLVAAIVSSLMLANFAFAQTTVNEGDSPEEAIVKGEWARYLTTPDSCAQFGVKLERISNKRFTAKYGAVSSVTNPLAYIFPGGMLYDSWSKGTGVIPHCQIYEYGTDGKLIEDINNPNASKLTTVLANLDDGAKITAVNFNQLAGGLSSVDDSSPATNFLLKVLAGIIKAITALMMVLTNIAGWILEYLVTSTVGKITTESMFMQRGWQIVRDVFNMFFILGLIWTAIRTILRLETNYRAWLGKFILMAILVNFSLVIGGTLISVVDSITTILADGLSFADYSRVLTKVVSPEGSQGLFNLNGGSAVFIESVIGFILAVIMFISYLAVAGMFFVRYVALQVLLVLAPAAYALNVFSETSRYFKQWWQTFFKYLMYAPIAVFFLRLGTRLITEPAPAINSGTPIPQGVVFNLDTTFSFLVIIAFFWMAVMVARSVGDKASNMLVGSALAGGTMVGKYMARNLGGTRHVVAGAGWGSKKLGAAFAGRPWGDRWTKLGKGATKVAGGMGAATAVVEGAPGYVRTKFNKWEKDRKTEIEKVYGTIDRFATGKPDTSKEAIERMSPEDLEKLALASKVNDKMIAAVLKHGNEDLIRKLGMLTMNYTSPDGKVSVKAVIEDDVLARKIENGIYRHQGGRGNAPSDFIKSAKIVTDDKNPEDKTKWRIDLGKDYI